jgi:hypothetical protein
MAMAALHAPPGEAADLRVVSWPPCPCASCPNATARRRRSGSTRCSSNVDPACRRGRPAAVQLHRRATLRHVAAAVRPARHVVGAAPAASRCRRCAFAAAARQLLAVQGPAGERLRLRLTSHAQLREAAGSGALPRVPASGRALARGFAYQEASEPPFGSMTSAGISGLLLARAGMAPRGEVDRALAGAHRRRGAATVRVARRRVLGALQPGLRRARRPPRLLLALRPRTFVRAGRRGAAAGRDWYYEGACSC